MDNRRKIIVIILLVSTVIVAVAAIILAQLVQNNQAPQSSSAFGFGEAVNKQYFDVFEERFKNIGCFGLLSNPIVRGYGNEGTTILAGYDLQILNQEPVLRNPVNCNIALDSSKNIDLSVYTYASNSAIDPDEETLFNRINLNILTISFQGNLNSGYFFYGKDKTDPTACRMNFFNQRNDFEYITLKVNGFNEDCSSNSQMLLAGELSYFLNKSVNSLIDQLVIEAQDDSTGN